jgi:hypothetical protein
MRKGLAIVACVFAFGAGVVAWRVSPGDLHRPVWHTPTGDPVDPSGLERALDLPFVGVVAGDRLIVSVRRETYDTSTATFDTEPATLGILDLSTGTGVLYPPLEHEVYFTIGFLLHEDGRVAWAYNTDTYDIVEVVTGPDGWARQQVLATGDNPGPMLLGGAWTDEGTEWVIHRRWGAKDLLIARPGREDRTWAAGTFGPAEPDAPLGAYQRDGAWHVATPRDPLHFFTEAGPTTIQHVRLGPTAEIVDTQIVDRAPRGLDVDLTERGQAGAIANSYQLARLADGEVRALDVPSWSTYLNGGVYRGGPSGLEVALRATAPEGSGFGLVYGIDDRWLGVRTNGAAVELVDVAADDEVVAQAPVPYGLDVDYRTALLPWRDGVIVLNDDLSWVPFPTL